MPTNVNPAGGASGSWEPLVPVDFAAISKANNSVFDSPKFVALPADKQKELKTKLFDTHVAPLLQKGGYEKLSADDFYSGKGLSKSYELSAGAQRGAGNILTGVGNITEWIDKTLGTSTKHDKELQDYGKKLVKETDYANLRTEHGIGKDLFWSGEQAAQLPVYEVAGGLTKGIPILKAVMESKGVLGFAGKTAVRAGEGALVGKTTNDSAFNSALGFAVIGGTGDAASAFLSKVVPSFGRKGVADLAKDVVTADAKGSKATRSMPSVVAVAGNPQEIMQASMMKMLDDFTAGKDFTTASAAEKKSALFKLANKTRSLGPEQQLINNPHLVALQTKASLTKDAPETQALAKVLDHMTGTPIEQDVAKVAVNKGKAIATAKVTPAQINAVGAAHTKAIQFEDNTSKMVDSFLKRSGLKDISFEDRGHKMLFGLNVLMAENQMGAKNDHVIQATFEHLSTRYPDKTPQQLAEMGDQLWRKAELATTSGIWKEGEPFRIWRQSRIDPNASPFKHEIELFKNDQQQESRQSFKELEKKSALKTTANPGKSVTKADKIERKAAIDTRITMLKKELKTANPMEKLEIERAIKNEQELSGLIDTRSSKDSDAELWKKAGYDPEKTVKLLSNSTGPGANYTEEMLTEIKRKHGIK